MEAESFRKELENYLKVERDVKMAQLDGNLSGYHLADFLNAEKSLKRIFSRARHLRVSHQLAVQSS